MCHDSFPRYWRDEEAYHIVNQPPFEVEDLFHQQKKQEEYAANNRSLAYCTLLDVLWQMCHAWNYLWDAQNDNPVDKQVI